MNPPGWMIPEGTHGVRADQIRKDWRRARAERTMEVNNLMVGQVCVEIIEGGRK